jgi:hypothetical protein
MRIAWGVALLLLTASWAQAADIIRHYPVAPGTYKLTQAPAGVDKMVGYLRVIDLGSSGNRRTVHVVVLKDGTGVFQSGAKIKFVAVTGCSGMDTLASAWTCIAGLAFAGAGDIAGCAEAKVDASSPTVNTLCNSVTGPLETGVGIGRWYQSVGGVDTLVHAVRTRARSGGNREDWVGKNGAPAFQGAGASTTELSGDWSLVLSTIGTNPSQGVFDVAYTTCSTISSCKAWP